MAGHGRGPRKGQLFWDNTGKQYGPGAAGSGWSRKTDFWGSDQPDDDVGEDYAKMLKNVVSDVDDLRRTSMSHHDLWLAEGEIFARLVEVTESPPNPVLRVNFKFQVTAQRPLILTEHHLSVKDIDTRDPLYVTEVDASQDQVSDYEYCERYAEAFDGCTERVGEYCWSAGVQPCRVAGWPDCFFPRCRRYAHLRYPGA